MLFTYLAGALFQADAVAPEGFIYRDIESGEMAVSWLQSTEDAEGGSIHVDGSAANGQAMAAHGYEYDASHGMFEMEYQSYERYYAPLERGEQPGRQTSTRHARRSVSAPHGDHVVSQRFS